MYSVVDVNSDGQAGCCSSRAVFIQEPGSPVGHFIRQSIGVKLIDLLGCIVFTKCLGKVHNGRAGATDQLIDKRKKKGIFGKDGRRDHRAHRQIKKN